MNIPRKIINTFITLFLLLLGAISWFFFQVDNQPPEISEIVSTPLPHLGMSLTSSAFGDQGMIPSEYTCEGEDHIPQLRISNVPDQAESLVLILHDPDAPSGDWLHWLVYNLPPQDQVIDQDTLPQDAQTGTNDFQNIGYDGPCPPLGEHRYVFDLYALADAPNYGDGIGLDIIMTKIKQTAIAHAQLVGVYAPGQ